ncbi:MAG: DUF1573 domain-containing protein [candidate division Zixibacteria bacterium]|nr:DUF1573 domain-containing protein [candidate division Zixibacteria bacterium]
MKWGHALVIICLVMVFAPSPEVAAAPKMRFSERLFDFGYMPEGLRAQHRYWLYNVGTDTLFVKSVKPSCGCTTVPLPRKQIRPGDSVPLDLSFDTHRYQLRVNKSVTVYSDDTTQPEAKIYFTAYIGDSAQAIRVEPKTAYLDTLGKEQQVITVTNASDRVYRVSLTSPPPGYMSVDIPAPEIPANSKAQLVLKAGPKTPVGEYSGSLTLRFAGPDTISFTVPIYGMGYYH